MVRRPKYNNFIKQSEKSFTPSVLLFHTIKCFFFARFDRVTNHILTYYSRALGLREGWCNILRRPCWAKISCCCSYTMVCFFGSCGCRDGSCDSCYCCPSFSSSSIHSKSIMSGEKDDLASYVCRAGPNMVSSIRASTSIALFALIPQVVYQHKPSSY